MDNHPARIPLHTKPLSLFQSLRVARRNMLGILPEIITERQVLSGKTGIRWHMIAEPEAIRRVLLERVEDYPKSRATKSVLRPAIGESMFVAEGAEWRWQRRAAAPAFSHRNILALAPVMEAAAKRSVARVQAGVGGVMDLYEEMITATFEVISDVTFTSGDSFDRDAVHHAIDNYIAQAGKVSILDMVGMPEWVPRPERLMSGSALRDMKRMADRAIDDRRDAPGDGVPDLLDLLMAAEDPETGRHMNTGEMRDNLLTFIVAGHETTALTLSWALYLCAFDQDVQDKARAEVQAVVGDRMASGDDVPNLPYIRAIVDEALRLYPPAAILSRTAQERDMLVGRDIYPGDTVLVPIYALHRHKALWDDPDAFRPERWADGRPVPRYGYLPFGDGPRICIGASFAIQEAVMILASLLSRFRFSREEGIPDPSPVMILTLRPEGGVRLKVDAV